jgi:hypothetical protein
MITRWLLALLTVAGASSPARPSVARDEGLRLLFVGNSLTYTHNVPDLVKRLAKAAGKPAPTVEMRASPNVGLEDHWREGWVAKALQKRRYDVLIMQQGPSTLATSGADLGRWAATFAAEAVKHGTRPALYGVWAPASGGMEASIANYRRAAEAAGAALYPAAAAWQAAWARRPSLPLYGPDGFHPSEHGAMLAAMVITGMVFDIDPAGMPNLFKGTISEEEMTVMRRAAAEAMKGGIR